MRYLIIPAIFAGLLMTVTIARAVPKHPRMWITADDLPRLRAMSGDTTENALGCVPAEAEAAILERADHFVAAPAYHYKVNMPGREGGPRKWWEYTLSDERPPRHDDYSHYPPTTAILQERSDSISTRLKYFLTAWLATGEEQYFDKAHEIVFHMCAWEGGWNDATYGEDHAGLDTSHAAIWVSLFYDWCYDLLTEDERTTVREALTTKALELLAPAAESGAVYHNITVLKLVGLTMGSIALLGEEERAEG